MCTPNKAWGFRCLWKQVRNGTNVGIRSFILWLACWMYNSFFLCIGKKYTVLTTRLFPIHSHSGKKRMPIHCLESEKIGKYSPLSNLPPSALRVQIASGGVFSNTSLLSAVYHDMIKDSEQRNLPVSRISLRRPKQTSVHIDKNFVLFISWKLH